MNRVHASLLGLSAAGLIGIVVHEGWRDTAYHPVPGDVPTIGFGFTKDVKIGDRITVERGVVRLGEEASKFEKAVQRCVHAPLYQYEFDAYVSLAYNIGEHAFCRSTLVKILNTPPVNYRAACDEILRWNKFQGRELPGLTKRRIEEHKKCIGAK